MSITFNDMWNQLNTNNCEADVSDDEVYVKIVAGVMPRGGKKHPAGTRVIYGITKNNSRKVPIHSDDDWFGATGKTGVRIGGVRRVATNWYRKTATNK